MTICLLTTSIISCLFRSHSCVPGGKLGVLHGETNSTTISNVTKGMIYSRLRRSGIATCPHYHFVWEHIDLLYFGQIRAGHDVPCCRRRHEFRISFHRRTSERASLVSVYTQETGLLRNAPNDSTHPVLWMMPSCWLSMFVARMLIVRLSGLLEHMRKILFIKYCSK